jgi:hypothetical protein
MTVAILLARKGSKGVKDKNKMSILGRPAFTYPIMAVQNSKYVDEVFISSDDEDIMKYADENGIRRVERPDYLATDGALFEDALVDAYFKIKEKFGVDVQNVVVLMGNALTVDNRLIDEALETLQKNPEADSAVTVTKFNMYSPLRARKLNSDGFLDPFVGFDCFGDPATLNCDRDSQGDVFFADMSHSVVRAKCLDDLESGLLPQKWMGQKIVPIYNTFGCDIDTSWQIDMTTRWLLEHNFSEEETPYK